MIKRAGDMVILVQALRRERETVKRLRDDARALLGVLEARVSDGLVESRALCPFCLCDPSRHESHRLDCTLARARAVADGVPRPG